MAFLQTIPSLTLVVGLIALVGCSRNIRHDQLDGQSSAVLKLSPRISAAQLENGLRYFYLRNSTPKGRCLVRLNVAIGSFVEDDHERGMAHLLEHLAFDDRSVSQRESLAEWLQKNGMAIGPDANASTYPESTLYKLDLPSCDKDGLTAALSILRSFADGLHFSDQAIDKEKNIVDAEEREYDGASNRITKRLISNLYSGTSYASRPVIGEKKVRSAFNQDMLSAFYQKWYAAPNLSVVLVGDFGDINPKELIEQAFTSLAKKDAPAKPSSGKPDHATPVFAIHEDNLAHVDTVFTVQAKGLAKPSFDYDAVRERLALDLAMTMLKEQFASQFREGKLIRETTIDGSFITDGMYELTLSVASHEANLEDAFLAAFQVLKQAGHKGFAEQTFLAAKARYVDALEQSVVSESTRGSDAWAMRIIDHINQTLVASDAVDYQVMAMAILQDLTAKDSQKVIKKAVASGHHYLYALGAINEGPATIKRLEQLLRKAKRADTTKLTTTPAAPFAYEVADCTMELPTPTTLPNVDATKAHLANGVEFMLKPTSWKKDEIVIEILTDEGYGGMSQRDVQVANIARPALLEGGLGKHEPADVARIIRNKYFQLSFSIYDDRIQTSIATRRQDLKFALALARAFVVDPGYAESALNRIKEQVKIQYAEKDSMLWAPLGNKFLKELTNNDYRVGANALEDLLTVTRAEIVAWHQKYIGNKRLKIVLVGDIDMATTPHDLACIFAELPTSERVPAKEVAQIKFKPGINREYDAKAKENSSMIFLRYPLNFPGKIYPDHRWQILQQVINEVLRLKLREKRQAAYSPWVSVGENKSPIMQNWLDISLLTEPDQAVKIRDAITKILAKLATRGIDATMLKKAKEPYLVQAQAALQRNSYWAAVLANHFAEAASVKWPTTIEKDVNAITIKDINQLLRQYFPVRNASSAVIHPSRQ